MDVYIDGVLNTTFSVTNTSAYQNYSVNAASLGTSAHTIEIAFSNDAAVASPAQDRNLYINAITLNGQNIASTADGVYYDIGIGVSASDGSNMLPGQTVMPWNGALRFSLDGNDRLDGGLGHDSMSGGFGNDLYLVDESGDIVSEAANVGIDTVQSSISYDLNQAANVENLTLTGITAINAVGSALDNILIGNTANNRLDGGLGIDKMLGGLGNDTYVVDNTGDTLTENVGSGTDTVESAVSWTLGANIENLTLTGTAAVNGTGNALGNVIIGNLAANILNGGDGNDILTGGEGADHFRFTTALGSNNIDTLTDFLSGTDKIDLSKAIFTTFSSLTVGSNLSSAEIGNHLLYDTNTGALAYDADGSAGAGAAVQIAILGTASHPASLQGIDFNMVA